MLTAARIGFSASLAGAVVLVAVAALVAAQPTVAFAQPASEKPVASSAAGQERLVAGELVTQTAEIGDRHLFLVQPGTAGPLRVDVEQHGVDVALVLQGPGISDELRVDSPSGRRGLESLMFHGQQGAQYELELRVASSVGEGGHYVLSLRALATGHDLLTQRRLAAERAMTLASRRFVEGGRTARQAALEDLKQALVGWQALGRRRDEVRTLAGIAFLERYLGDLVAAQASYQQACDGWQGLADEFQFARCLNDLGYVLWSLGRGEEALSRYRQALDLWRGLPGTVNSRAQTLNNLGLAYHSSGDLDLAAAHYREALADFRESLDQRREGVVLGNLAGVFDLQGEPREALRFLRRAMALHEQADDAAARVRALNNMASIQRRAGDYQAALEGYRQALEGSKALGDRRGMARVLNNLGLVFENLGEMEAATEHLQHSLALRREVADRRGEAVTLHNLGRLAATNAATGPEAALALLAQALELRRRLADRRGEAITLRYLGRTLSDLGRQTKAIEKLQQAIAILETLDAPFSLASSLWDLGRARLRGGDPKAASVDLRRALAMFQDGGSLPGEARVRLELASALRALDQPQEALLEVTGALEHIEALRSGVASIGFRTSFQAAHFVAYELQVDLLMDRWQQQPDGPFAQRALEVSEQSRARGLLDLLSSTELDLTSDAESSRIQQRELLLQRLRSKWYRQERAIDQRKTKPIQQLRQSIDGLLTELASLDGELRQRNPKSADQFRPQALQVPEMQALLDAETVLLQYFLGVERSYLWAVSDQRVVAVELPAKATIQAAARKVHESWRTLDPASLEFRGRAARRLSDLILAPVASQIRHRRLLIAADGALHLVPFAALPVPSGDGELLIDEQEIVHIPSASVLAWQRQEAGRRVHSGSPKLAIFADPVFSALDPRLPAAVRRSATGEMSPFDRLPWTRQEAEAVAAHVVEGNVTFALGLEAVRERVMAGDLQHHQILHFATHGIIDGERPELSGLVFSQVDEQGRKQEGFLALYDIYGLRLEADLVVLSGCETALGETLRGEGVVGLTRGFFHAGASRLMASLWRIEDRATAELMGRFYRHHLVGNMTAAAALRQAQLDLRADPRWRDPYYWAAFVVSGDWR